MVFGLGRGETDSRPTRGVSSFFRRSQGSTAVTSTTDPSSNQNSQVTSETWSHAPREPEEAKPEEAPQEKDNTRSSLDSEQLGEVFASELDEKKTEGIKEVNVATVRRSVIDNEINQGNRAIEEAAGTLAKTLQREDGALTLLAEHSECLNGLRKNLESQVTTFRETVTKENTASKRLETELAAAEEAVTAARAGADEAQLKRAENVAANTAAVAEADDRVVAVNAQMVAATERHNTTEASVAAMRKHIVELREKVAACEREKDFALGAKESTGKENEAAVEVTQKAADLSANSAAALKAHVEDSERRVLGHEAELRRCQNRLKAAEKLRDLRSRIGLHDQDSSSLETARDNAKSAADQAAVDLAAKREALRTTKEADQARTSELTAVADKASQNFSQRELAAQATANRYAERKKVAFNARALHTAAVAAHDTVVQELELTEKRAAELQEAAAVCALKVQDARRQAAQALHSLSAEELPLRHAEQAESIVLQSKEQERANIRRALEVSRLSAKEAEADALQLSATDSDLSDVSADHGMVISEMEVRLQEKELMVQQARVAREAAERGLADAQAELKTAEEAVFPGSLSASNTMEEWESEGQQKFSQENQMRKTLSIASVDSHKSRLNAAVAEEEMTTAALAGVNAELERARAAAAAQSTAVKQLKAVDLIPIEIADVARCQQQHSDKVVHLKADETKASAKWGEKRESLKADLHNAEMALRLATENLTFSQGVRDSFKE